MIRPIFKILPQNVYCVIATPRDEDGNGQVVVDYVQHDPMDGKWRVWQRGKAFEIALIPTPYGYMD